MYAGPYRKIRFMSQQHGATAGLVVTDAQLAHETLQSVSRLFPVSEFRKMERYQSSPPFATWDAAFLYQFPSP